MYEKKCYSRVLQLILTKARLLLRSGGMGAMTAIRCIDVHYSNECRTGGLSHKIWACSQILLLRRVVS